jgi:hypothetical protein
MRPLLASSIVAVALVSTTAMSTSAPSCALSPEQLRAQREKLLPGLMKRAKVSDLRNGVRLRFAPKPGLLKEIAGIMEKEQVCCSFLRFALTVESGGGDIVFDITGPKGTRELLKSL